MSIRKIYYRLSPDMRFVSRKLYYLPVDLIDTIIGRRNKYEPPKGDIYIGSGNFIKQGEHQVALLKKYLSLREDDTVLDVGSGIGRTAIPLTKHLGVNGRYEGFDVVEKGVIWCTSKIKNDFPNFNFKYVALNNDLYNDSSEPASQFQFPYPDNHFDVVFLFSVFTHMMVDEIEHYLQEIQRVLKPKGLCLATFFIYTQDNEEAILKRPQFNFPVKKEGYRLMSDDVKSANIAIQDLRLDLMLSSAKLKKINFVDGYWKDMSLKQSFVDFQDIVVLQK